MIGRKIGMTSVFNDKGQVVPVTVIEVGPVTVMQVKTEDKDGYTAVQLGFGEKKLQRAKKPEVGHAQKAGAAPKEVLREVRVPAERGGEFEAGKELTLADLDLSPGSFVDVIGVSKGKGYQGVMKRHNYGGGKSSHGVHEYKRHGGSIGCSATPSRVRKGTKMAGQMGSERVTVQNIKVVEVRAEQNLLFLNGAVPGHSEAIVTVRVAKKKGGKKSSEEAA